MAKQTIVELARKRTFVLVKLGLEVEMKNDKEEVEEPGAKEFIPTTETRPQRCRGTHIVASSRNESLEMPMRSVYPMEPEFAIRLCRKRNFFIGTVLMPRGFTYSDGLASQDQRSYRLSSWRFGASFWRF